MTTQKQISGIIGQISRIREQANLLIEKQLREADIEGILPAHGSILNFLFQKSSPVSMKEIVEQVNRVKSTVTGMINTLEQYGYVKKFQSLEDGRVILVELTDKGAALKEQVSPISKKLQEKVYGDMPQADRETLVILLQKILNNLAQ